MGPRQQGWTIPLFLRLVSGLHLSWKRAGAWPTLCSDGAPKACVCEGCSRAWGLSTGALLPSKGHRRTSKVAQDLPVLPSQAFSDRECSPARLCQGGCLSGRAHTTQVNPIPAGHDPEAPRAPRKGLCPALTLVVSKVCAQLADGPQAHCARARSPCPDQRARGRGEAEGSSAGDTEPNSPTPPLTEQIKVFVRTVGIVRPNNTCTTWTSLQDAPRPPPPPPHRGAYPEGHQ